MIKRESITMEGKENKDAKRYTHSRLRATAGDRTTDVASQKIKEKQEKKLFVLGGGGQGAEPFHLPTTKAALLHGALANRWTRSRTRPLDA